MSLNVIAIYFFNNKWYNNNKWWLILKWRKQKVHWLWQSQGSFRRSLHRQLEALLHCHDLSGLFACEQCHGPHGLMDTAVLPQAKGGRNDSGKNTETQILTKQNSVCVCVRVCVRAAEETTWTLQQWISVWRGLQQHTCVWAQDMHTHSVHYDTTWKESCGNMILPAAGAKKKKEKRKRSVWDTSVNYGLMISILSRLQC